MSDTQSIDDPTLSNAKAHLRRFIRNQLHALPRASHATYIEEVKDVVHTTLQELSAYVVQTKPELIKD